MRAGTAIRVALVLGVVAMLGACMKPPTDERTVARELHGYLEKFQSWEDVEREILDAINRAERTRFVDDDEVIAIIDHVRTDLREHNAAVAAIEPETRELREVHRFFLDAWRNLERAYDDVVATLERKDYVELAKAKSRMLAARQQILSAVSQIKGLIDEFRPFLEEVDRQKRATPTAVGTGPATPAPPA